MPKRSAIKKGGAKLPSQLAIIPTTSSSDHGSDENEKVNVSIISDENVYIDPAAEAEVYQLVRASKGLISKAVGLPDLHVGPTGVAILARAPLARVPGPDIGCGMSLFATDIPAGMVTKKIAKRMLRLNLDEGEDFEDSDIGTIGGGNHFAELQYLDPDVPLDPEFERLLGPDARDRSKAFLMVHSGSRSHGSRLFAELGDGKDPERYMREHVKLVEWAKRNRMEIASRFLHQFAYGIDCQAQRSKPPLPLIDIAHNFIEELADGEGFLQKGFLHRKGAAPSHPGSLSLLPGSRATASYVLVCQGEMGRDLCSVAHGAGRRLSRSDARKQGRALGLDNGRHKVDLTREGTIVCGCKNLLAEESESAYKDVEGVVSCLVAGGHCRVGARLLPLATYKTRRGAPDDHKAQSLA